MANTLEVAEEFIAESDAQQGMSDVHVKYMGEEPEKAYKILGINQIKVVNEEGLIISMPTYDFVGGVIYGLADLGEINPVEWTDSRVLNLCMNVGRIIGLREENRRLMQSAGKAAVNTERGKMLPIMPWIVQERSDWL